MGFGESTLSLLTERSSCAVLWRQDAFPGSALKRSLHLGKLLPFSGCLSPICRVGQWFSWISTRIIGKAG